MQVSPELVQVSTASTKWQAALRGPAHRRVPGAGRHRRREWPRRSAWRSARASASSSPSGRPQNLAAYDAFLRGEEAVGGNATMDPVALRRARDYYEQAVALDSSFALAWAQLSRAYSLLYLERPEPRSGGGGSPGRRAVAGARAQAPGRAIWPSATTTNAVRHDAPRALEQYTRGRQLAPRDARLLAWAGWAEFLLGRVEEGLAAHARGGGARPAIGRYCAAASRGHCSAAVGTRRRLPPLSAPARSRRATSLVIVTVVSAHLAQGDLAGARAVLRSRAG